MPKIDLSDLRKNLSEVLTEVRAKKIDNESANVIWNLAGKIISSHAVEVKGAEVELALEKLNRTHLLNDLRETGLVEK